MGEQTNKRRCNKWRTKSKMATVTHFSSVLTLSVNELNSPIKSGFGKTDLI